MTLHPQSRAYLNALELAGAPGWHEIELQQARQLFDSMPMLGEGPELTRVEQASVAEVPVRIYRPGVGDTNASVGDGFVVYFHGGGWVLGGLDSHDAVCRRLAAHANLPLVSVDYRRPPEDRFPAAVEDCFTVCDLLATDHRQFGFGDSMIVAGDSAGGNLAAAVSLMSRERGGPAIAGQLLIYPVLDGSMSTGSYHELGEGYGLTRETMAWFWDQYTNKGEASLRDHPLASPGQVEDLSRLPATHILVAEYDVLRDEAIAFARRLSDAGVPTTLEHCDGMLHGFVHLAEAFDESHHATRRLAECCRRLANG